MYCRGRWLLAVAFLVCPASGNAQDTASTLPSAPIAGQPVPDPAVSAPCACLVIPALTIVDIEIVDPISSLTAKTGDTFAIRLSAPIHVDGKVAIPAGAMGRGEVIHAQKSGMGGGGGELLLAARYIDVEGRRLRLRSFRAGRYGKNQTGAALATSYFLGPFGLAVKGKNTEFAAGSIAEAKLAEAFVLSLASLPAHDAGGHEQDPPATVLPQIQHGMTEEKNP